jgi:hypothetical protein
MDDGPIVALARGVFLVVDAELGLLASFEIASRRSSRRAAAAGSRRYRLVSFDGRRVAGQRQPAGASKHGFGKTAERRHRRATDP